jgi:cell division protein FtsQ
VRYDTSGGKTAISILVLAVALVFYLFANSAFFEADRVEWTGLVYLDQAQLDVYLDFSTVNVWRLNTKELETVVLEHPWIEGARVIWRWPNQVIISVTERTPVAQIPGQVGWFLLDREGNLLPAIQGDLVLPLPVVTNLDLGSKEQLVSTARLMTLIPPALKPIISEWNTQTRSFISRSGTEILIGSQVDLEEKFLLLEKIVDDLASRQEQARKIDLRVPKNPVVSIL